MKRLLPLLAACLLSTAALADPPSSDDAPFTDWLTLADHLRAHGIDPVAVNWLPIENMCLGLKKTDTQIAYNKCKFEKALNMRQFNADTNGCDAQANADYPDSLRFDTQGRSFTITESVQTGQPATSSKIIEERNPGLSRSQIRDLRRAAFVRCMQGNGWANADSWMDGRREAPLTGAR